MTRKRVLTDEQVKQIRAMHVPYVMGYGRIAKLFKVGESTVRDVCKYWTRAGVR